MTAYCARCRIPLKTYERAIAPRGSICDFCRDRERHPEAYITHQSLPADCYFGPGALGPETPAKPRMTTDECIAQLRHEMQERYRRLDIVPPLRWAYQTPCWHESAEPPYDSAGVARCIHCGIVMNCLTIKLPCNHGLLKDDLLNGDAFKHKWGTEAWRFQCPECRQPLTVTLQP